MANVALVHREDLRFCILRNSEINAMLAAKFNSQLAVLAGTSNIRSHCQKRPNLLAVFSAKLRGLIFVGDGLQAMALLLEGVDLTSGIGNLGGYELCRLPAA